MMWRGSKPSCVHGNQSYFVIPICLHLRKQSFQNLQFYLFRHIRRTLKESLCVHALTRNILSSFTLSKKRENGDGSVEKVEFSRELHKHEHSGAAPAMQEAAS